MFGGSFLAKPSKFVLNLNELPRHYEFSNIVNNKDNSNKSKADFIEALYESINDFGNNNDSVTNNAIVEETILAFQLNESIYKDFPRPLLLYAFVGALNVSMGALKQNISKNYNSNH